MTRILDEQNLCFDFTNCPLVSDPVKFDTKTIAGLSSVDFVAETEDCIYFVEVKDFQNPNAPEERRKADLETLIAAGREKPARKKKPATNDEFSTVKAELSAVRDQLSLCEGSAFTSEIGQKIKDSLLRKYAFGEQITKDIKYLVLINLDNLGTRERGRLKEKISGHIPTGLNAKDYGSFVSINFDLVDANQLKKYGITCTAKEIA